MTADFQINSASYGEVVPEVLGTIDWVATLFTTTISHLMNIAVRQELVRVAAQSIPEQPTPILLHVLLALCEGPSLA